MRSVEVNGSRIHVVGVVKGLVSEEGKVESAFSAIAPDVVGLSVSKEQLTALRSKEVWEEYDLSPLEAAYKTLLEEFGEVRLPSPAFVKALELGKFSNIPIIPIDMNDLDYTETYCVKVGAVDLVREGAFSKSVKKRRFEGASPESFAIDWDRRVNKAKGFRELEGEREAHMAFTLKRMTSRYSEILALVDYERSEGVITHLRSR
jgi:hypothetical protein